MANQYMGVIVLLIVLLAFFVLWTKRPEAEKETHGGWSNHLHADPSLQWYRKKENYGDPPGMIRAVHQDELGFRGWADMPGDYEGSSASAVSAYAERSA